jgi:RNA polymerase-binding transcription factor DksA
MTDLKKRETQLRTRLAELESRLAKIEDQLDNAPNPDWEENAQESEGDETLEALGRAGANEIRAIHAALDRIAKGTYGECVKCGEEILEERLDLLPHTPFCGNCARGN